MRLVGSRLPRVAILSWLDGKTIIYLLSVLSSFALNYWFYGDSWWCYCCLVGASERCSLRRTTKSPPFSFSIGGVDAPPKSRPYALSRFVVSYWDLGSRSFKFIRFLGNFMVCRRLGRLSSRNYVRLGLYSFNCFILVCTEGSRRIWSHDGRSFGFTRIIEVINLVNSGLKILGGSS